MLDLLEVSQSEEGLLASVRFAISRISLILMSCIVLLSLQLTVCFLFGFMRLGSVASGSLEFQCAEGGPAGPWAKASSL